MEQDRDDHAPLYLSELQSIRRGVSAGWYAVDKAGDLHSGPFLSREICLNNLPRPQR
jgi:hypothetical protein